MNVAISGSSALAAATIFCTSATVGTALGLLTSLAGLASVAGLDVRLRHLAP